MEEEERIEPSRLAKLGTLGGKITFNSKLRTMYLGGKSPLSKERLFGISGPLHPGMEYHKGEMALSSVSSDTSQDLVRELQGKGLTREEARQTIADLLKAGALHEVWDPDLQKSVLVMRS